MKLQATFSLIVAMGQAVGLTSAADCPAPYTEEWMMYLEENCRGSSGLDNDCCFIAPPLVRISAEDAFDAYQRQKISHPQLGELEGVVMIDMRTPEEYYWTGSAAQVTSISSSTEGYVVPDLFKTKLEASSSQLSYSVNGSQKRTSIKKIDSITIEPIAFNAPVEYRNVHEMGDAGKILNEDIGADIMNVVNQFSTKPPSAAVFFCRSGKRSTVGCYYGYCSELLTEFQRLQIASFEIELPGPDGSGEINGHGGFEGGSYGDSYNGYRGFPGRLSNSQEDYEAVDFKDTGLPIKIGSVPLRDVSQFSKPWACDHDSVDSGVCYV